MLNMNLKNFYKILKNGQNTENTRLRHIVSYIKPKKNLIGYIGIGIYASNWCIGFSISCVFIASV